MGVSGGRDAEVSESSRKIETRTHEKNYEILVINRLLKADKRFSHLSTFPKQFFNQVGNIPFLWLGYEDMSASKGVMG